MDVPDVKSEDADRIAIPTPFVQRLVLTAVALIIVLAFIVLPAFAGWSKAGLGARALLFLMFAIEAAISLWLLWHALSSQVIMPGPGCLTVSRRLGPLSTRRTIQNISAVELDRSLRGSGRGTYLAETLSVRVGSRTHQLHTLQAELSEAGPLVEIGMGIALLSEVPFVDRRAPDLI